MGSSRAGTSGQRPLAVTAVARAIAEFGHEAAAKLAAGVGQREALIRGPVEDLVRQVGRALGLDVRAFDEVSLSEISIRPDFAVRVGSATVGYLELKAPGKRVPDTWSSPTAHDRKQWQRLALLPNVLYTDGQEWALYHSGQLAGRVARLAPTLDHAGRRLAAVDGDFEQVVAGFLTWGPERPRTVAQLVRAVAGLCRLLREEIGDSIEREARGLVHGRTMTDLARDWRELLFPRLDDKDFADAYAQTVTFALLLARNEGIDFSDVDVHRIARQLGKKHLLLGKALDVLTDEYLRAQHGVAIDTLLRVIGTVDWTEFPEDTYVDLYEEFLERYDPALRRRSGSYYTPGPLVAFMTQFVDEILRNMLGLGRGLGDEDVIVVDPAMGTGSYLAHVVERVAETARNTEGSGAVAGRLRSLAKRLIGFEKQAAPFAVAELRLHGAFRKRAVDIPDEELRFLADTLDDPELQHDELGSMYEAIKQSRRGADRLKRETPVMVVLGNPPYLERAGKLSPAPWIEEHCPDRALRPSLDAFRAPGMGRYEQRMYNLYVYFWRWATWKVFDAHPSQARGVVAFVTTSAYTTGPGFAGMREYLRRTADEGWIIDLSPEGHQSNMGTRVFRANQHPLCIGVFVRCGPPNPSKPASIRFATVAGIQDEKFRALHELTIDSPQWRECRRGWQDPLLPPTEAGWDTYVAVGDLLPWSGPGMRSNRTWVYASRPGALQARWNRLISAPAHEKNTLFKETPDSNLDRVPPPVEGFIHPRSPFRSERGQAPAPVKISYRSFDRQWVIPDPRLHHRPSPDLWAVHNPHQVFVSEQHAHAVTAGPALVFAAHVPDMHHFQGHHGGRVLPLFRDADGRISNTAPAILDHLSARMGIRVSAEDLLAYIAATTGHPAFTARFHEPLATPGGIRVPLTADRQIWLDAVEIGRMVVWLHTYGERFADPQAGRPARAPSLPHAEQPRVILPITDNPRDLPNRIDYDAASRALLIGKGRIEPVPPTVYAYQVSGMPIVRKWFNYRSARPRGRRGSPLDDIRPNWDAETTGNLLDLLNVLGLCVALEPSQAELLNRILGGPIIDVADLTRSGVLPVPISVRRPPRRHGPPDLWQAQG
ncbi:MAG: type ISP restriction/modification enzyme [Pseudonocardiaceae bacterium]